MAWQQIRGHDRQTLLFARALARQRLGGTFLFTGSAGIGKRTFAMALTKTLLCLHREPISEEQLATEEGLAHFVPCNRCESCRLFENSRRLIDGELPTKNQKDVGAMPTHPDLHYICKPVDKTEIPLELLIGSKEKRMREGLCYDLFKKPFVSSRNIAIIDDADSINDEGANALLKTLEEPPGRAIIILIGTAASRQLPTIRSRSRVVRFSPLSQRDIAEILLDKKQVNSLQHGLQIAADAHGSLSQLGEPEETAGAEFQGRLFRLLARAKLDSVEISTLLNQFIDDAGTVLTAKRNRLRQIFIAITNFYRGFLLFQKMSPGADMTGSPILRPLYSEMKERQTDAGQTIIRAIDRTLDALEQIDRNATPALIIDSWTDDLAWRILR